MKKKNLLTLGALVLSLGLTVTSCAGAKGEDGAPGKDGTNGKDGKDGKDGTDGKTYLAVINLDRIEGVKVKQSAYFIEPGESVTFTFEPETSAGAKEIIVDLELNGEVVEDVLEADDNGVVTWTWKSTAESKGAQLTGGLYTDADKLGDSLVVEYLSSLQENDILLTSTNNATLFKNGVTVSGLSDAEFLDEEYSDAKEALSEVTEKWGDDTTISTKVSEIKAAVAKIKETIDADYKELIEDAIVDAKASAEDLDADIDSDGYDDEDREANIKAVNAELDSCKTLLDIAKVINETEVKDESTSEVLVGVGSFAQLTDRRDDAFVQLDSALSGVKSKESWMFADKTSTAYKTVATKLESLGISVESLPTSVYKDYASQIAKATSLEIYTSGTNKGKTKLGKEGADAVKKSVSSLKTQIVEAVRASYYKELEDSSKLTSNIVAQLKGVVDAALSDWVSVSTSTNISDYLSTTAPTPLADQTAMSGYVIKENGVKYSAVGGLQGFVEACFVANDTLYTAAFNTERLTNAGTKALAAFQAQIDAIKAADKEFAQINAGRHYDADNKVDGYLTVQTLGLTGATVANNGLFTTAIPAKDGNSYWAKTSEWGEVTVDTGVISAADKTVKTEGTTTVVANVDAWYDTLKEQTTSNTGLVKKSGTKVADVKAWQDLHVTDFEVIYDAMLSSYVTKQAITATAPAGSVFVTNKSVLSAFSTALGYTYTFNTVSSVAKTTASAQEALEVLDDGMNAELVGTTATGEIVDNDERYISWLTITNVDASNASKLGADSESDVGKKVAARGSTSALIKGFKSELAAILAGTASKKDVEKWVANMDDLYASDCSARLKSNLELITEKYQDKLNEVNDPDTYEDFKGTFNAVKALAGHIVALPTVYVTAGYGLASFSVADSIDLTTATAAEDKLTNATNDLVFTKTISNVGYTIVDLRGENFSSADLVYKVLSAIVESADGTGDDVPSTIEEINTISLE